jgi:hypothetical protein
MNFPYNTLSDCISSSVTASLSIYSFFARPALNRDRLTISIIPRVHKPRTNAQEQNSFLSILRTKLRNGHIQRCFGDRIDRIIRNLVFSGNVNVGMSGGDGDDFFDTAGLD